MRPSCHHHIGAGYLQVLRLGDIVRCPRGAFTHLVRCLLTGCPSGGPHSCSPGVTGRLAVIISASGSLSPTAIGIRTTRGSHFVSRGVKGDSQPRRLTQRLHCLLVQGCWPTPGIGKGLAEGWHHLRSLWCQSLRCLSLPVQSGSHVCSPPNRRLVPQGSR